MSAALKKPKLAFLYAVCIILMIQYARTQTFGQAELVYEWKWLEIDWPTEADERNATNNGSFVPNRNLLSGVKVRTYICYIFPFILKHFFSHFNCLLANFETKKI